MKLAFNIGGAVVMFDVQHSKLWVVFTQEQYHEIDERHGRFIWSELALPKRASFHKEPAVQYLSGNPADMLGAAMLGIYQGCEPPEVFRKRLSVGITSVNWRLSAVNSCTVVLGNSGGKIFFAVVFTVPQLQELQRQCFPHEPWRVAAFNSRAQLPSAADELAFVLVEENIALQCIQACAVSRLMG